MSPEDRNDEVQPLKETEEDDEYSNDEETPTVTITRSGRVSKPFDFVRKYPDIYGESELGITVTKLDSPKYKENIKRLQVDEYQHYVEALEWFDFGHNDISSMVFKAKQMSIQQGIKTYGDKGKESALNEIRNLTENECFGEVEYNTLTQEMKNKALPILMFMIMKRNGLIKTRGVADGSKERVYIDKNDCSSPNPGFLFI